MKVIAEWDFVYGDKQCRAGDEIEVDEKDAKMMLIRGSVKRKEQTKRSYQRKDMRAE